MTISLSISTTPYTDDTSLPTRSLLYRILYTISSSLLYRVGMMLLTTSEVIGLQLCQGNDDVYPDVLYTNIPNVNEDAKNMSILRLFIHNSIPS